MSTRESWGKKKFVNVFAYTVTLDIVNEDFEQKNVTHQQRSMSLKNN